MVLSGLNASVSVGSVGSAVVATGITTNLVCPLELRVTDRLSGVSVANTTLTVLPAAVLAALPPIAEAGGPYVLAAPLLAAAPVLGIDGANCSCLAPPCT